ncbi:hypothetical protein TRAPUB_11457 [Trametes pubescens]|uniref:Uncharacterized protein n=1 Tax=Trametes pubescens TaxID=154538 RepID=A0A1M2VWJ1_TRAPU|nr:hypothetical protein TRAPUB_11457 [Trametes pubescens]
MFAHISATIEICGSIPNPQRASIMVDHVNDIFEQIKALPTPLNPEALKASAKEVVADYASRLWGAENCGTTSQTPTKRDWTE